MKSKDQRREEGEIRNAEWRKLSPVQKVVELDRRLGVGVGAKRQRSKLPQFASLSEARRIASLIS
jgi:hypothetical protein